MGVQVRMTFREGHEYPIGDMIAKYSATRYVAAHEVGADGAKHVHVYMDLSCEVDANLVKKVRSWCNYKGWTGAQLCVKKWGDTDADLRYFFKGDTRSRRVNISHSTFGPAYQMEQNRAWWAVADTVVDKKRSSKAERCTVVTAFVEYCRSHNVVAGGRMFREELCEAFVQWRKGKDQVDPMKHRGVILSAYAALMDEAGIPEGVEDVANMLFQKCFVSM